MEIAGGFEGYEVALLSIEGDVVEVVALGYRCEVCGSFTASEDRLCFGHRLAEGCGRCGRNVDEGRELCDVHYVQRPDWTTRVRVRIYDVGVWELWPGDCTGWIPRNNQRTLVEIAHWCEASCSITSSSKEWPYDIYYEDVIKMYIS